MSWSRTVRIDREIDQKQRASIAAAFQPYTSVRFGANLGALKRTYALVQSRAESDSGELEHLIAGARWFERAIIVLAIEPTPADALQAIHAAFSGPGAPAGIIESTTLDLYEIVEFQPERTAPGLILQMADVELRRTHGYRNVHSLAPLPADLMASITAAGLQAPEIAPDRILETLLEQSGIE